MAKYTAAQQCLYPAKNNSEAYRCVVMRRADSVPIFLADEKNK